MPRSSATSAGATYLDRAHRIEEVRQAARRARERLPTITRVVLFGSLATGEATPRSDADLLIVVTDSPHARPADRIPDMLRALSPLPCPLDLLVVTADELARARGKGDPLVREAVAGGLDLL